MYTNLSIRLLCFWAILLLHSLRGSAQVSVYPIGCSGLRASMESISIPDGEKNSYTLEVLKSAGRWMSINKNHSQQLASEFANLAKGIYRVKVVVSGSGSGNRSLLESDPIAIDGCPFTPGSTSGESIINLRPNPAASTLEVQILSGLKPDQLPVTLEIFDGLGHNVEIVELSSANTTISVAHLPVGVYFASVKNNSNLVAVEKLMIKR